MTRHYLFFRIFVVCIFTAVLFYTALGISQQPQVPARDAVEEAQPLKHAAGGMVFPDAQLEMFPRLERFDVAFDIPEAFLPEFPPAIFLQNRPELGDASRGDSSASNVQGSHKTFPKLTTKSLASTNSVSLRFWN